MARIRPWTLIVSCAVVIAVPAPAKDSASGSIAAAVRAYQTGDCAKALTLAAPIVNKGGAESGDIATAFDVTIDCSAQRNDWDKVQSYATRATARDDSTDYVWRMLVLADLQTKHYARAIDTLERMTMGRGAALNSVPSQWMWLTYRNLDAANDNANALRLLKIMSDPAYQPDDDKWEIDGDVDSARVLYARKLIAVGKTSEAQAQLEGIKGYGSLSTIIFDPELRALYARPIDLRAAVEADLIAHRALTEKYPRSLDALNAVASDLHLLGRDDEVIAMLVAAMRQAESVNAYDDRSHELPWFWNELGEAYAVTGRYDDMLAAYGKGMAMNEGGSTTPNVSQLINLAGQQYRFDRPKDALATMAQMSAEAKASPYGKMEAHLMRGCAYARLKDEANTRAELAYLVANENDDRAALTQIYLCMGNEEAAAASFIRRLGDPRARSAALRELSDYDAPNPRAPVSPVAPLFERLRKRADVQAAIRAAGGPFRIHLQYDPLS